MIPLYVMLAGVLVARGLGALGWGALADWTAATRIGLAAMFLFTGVAHFGRERADLVRMVPPEFPRAELLVTLTGLAELIGAAGLLLPPVSRWAAWSLVALLVAVFPANLYAARTGHRIAGRQHTPLMLRAPLQVLWIGLLLWVAG
jgi:uncharacterized membrane protein